jgi:type IV secretion system protein VirD4
MTRTIQAPQSSAGLRRALAICAVAFVLLLSFETQRFARLDGYGTELGAPVVSRIYAPWGSIEWMLRWDIDLNPFVPERKRDREATWARAAFEAERRDLLWGGAFALVALLALSIALSRPRRNSDIHGGAGWATSRDVRRSALSNAEYGIVLGQTRSGQLLIHNGEENVLVIGPPGEGKTDGIAVPTLLKTWPHWSAIVFDPANELTPLTATVRAQQTRVVVFDPRSPTTARYNPLAGIAVGDVDGVRTIMAAYLLERDLSEMTEQERYFNGSALELGTALAAHAIELGTPTLEAAARYYYSVAWENDRNFCESLLKSTIPYVSETGSKYARMEAKGLSGIVATLTQQLDIFRTPDVARATSASDISPADFRRAPTTLYLVVRERDQPSLSPLMRLLLSRFLDDLTESRPEPNEHILLLLDEFPLLRASIVARKLATFRKYLIHPVLLAQSLAQIRASYGQQETISGLCDVRVFFPSVDPATQDLASRTCGQTTRWAESLSRDGSSKKSRSVSEVGRPMLYPHELAELKSRNEIIVYKKGDRPFVTRPVRAHSDPRFTD